MFQTNQFAFIKDFFTMSPLIKVQNDRTDDEHVQDQRKKDEKQKSPSGTLVRPL
ncbi:hypothetical protein [Albibacterium indicum]|uniref:hypothetical protein n=1 Tax=Albibacterium indicum TaxID=2292082 RepID=UPI001300490A|nr:hypothetical protein [Pedobacter indicus]